jgi:hypothetical protein
MLAGMGAGGSELVGPERVGLVVAISFAAGLNVYATVATLGCWRTRVGWNYRRGSIC